MLLESGGPFLGPAEFAQHQRAMREYFGLSVGPPVDLWPQAPRGGGPPRALARGPKSGGSNRPIPYVRYVWPRCSVVRDFSRAVPVAGNGGEVIARMPGFPVAIKRRVANGLLILLGSPLGPALNWRDREALSWLGSVVP